MRRDARALRAEPLGTPFEEIVQDLPEKDGPNSGST
jgi:hypothetical protein